MRLEAKYKNYPTGDRIIKMGLISRFHIFNYFVRATDLNKSVNVGWPLVINS